MGRPRVHTEETRDVLLDAAERLVEGDGVKALSVRRLADDAGTSTRAVYSLFGSKAGLLDALGSRAFDWLTHALEAQAPTNDPIADLIDAGAVAFRCLVVDHPALFKVGVQAPKSGPETDTSKAADRALGLLVERLDRLQHAGLLRHHTVFEAAWQFHALCEGLATLELRGAIPAAQPQEAWRAALRTLVNGLLLTQPTLQ